MFSTSSVTLCPFLLALAALPSFAQTASTKQDPALDNLVHAPDYVTGELGELGRVDLVGEGPRSMILIAGAGFGADIFTSFMESRKEEFTMYAVTLPGFGGTPAPPMPPEGTSYGEQTWTRSTITGLTRLIEQEGLDSPIIVAHWINASGIALRLALEQPEAVSALVIISGVTYNASSNPESNPDPPNLETRVARIDRMMAPFWFKTVTRDTWDDNNFLPGNYARHPLRALQLWRMAASAPLPVMVRYLCEHSAQNIRPELEFLQVPTLVLKPGFDAQHYFPEGRNFMQSYTHKSWEGADEENPNIRLQTIENSRAFIMDDQPEALNAAVDAFLD